MSEIFEQIVNCPYCGESIEVLIETIDSAQEYIEDCQVCCRPINFVISTDYSGNAAVSVYHENEVY